MWILECARSAIRFNYHIHIFERMKITLHFLQILHSFSIRIIVSRVPLNLLIQQASVWHPYLILFKKKNTVCFYLIVVVANNFAKPQWSELLSYPLSYGWMNSPHCDNKPNLQNKLNKPNKSHHRNICVTRHIQNPQSTQQKFIYNSTDFCGLKLMCLLPYCYCTIADIK